MQILCFVFLVILSVTQQRLMAEGRVHLKTAGFSKMSRSEESSNMILRPRIGSRPPQCERRCRWCGHCEAIQVPIGNKRRSNNNIEYARGDDTSNYKPMTWKCKCGSFIFNP